MLPFEPGQRIVCIDAEPREDTGAPILLAYLREGTIYTVRSREVHRSADGHPTLRLEEIRCPTINTSHGAWEIGFAPDRFRPVKSSSIEAFQDILVREQFAKISG